MDDRPHGSAWRTPVLSFVVAAVLLLAGWGIHRGLDAALAAHERDCEEILEAFPVDQSPRPAILGSEESGNVWELLVPAFAGIKALDEYDNFNNFDAHGTTGDTPRLIEASRPYLDSCRRAAARRDRTWKGLRAPGLVFPTLAARALSSRGVMAWRDGRDAEAADWMVVALTVAYDSAAIRGDQPYEVPILQDFRELLSEQALSAAQLEELGRRLKLLRSIRPGFVQLLRRGGARGRLDFHFADPWMANPDSPNGSGGQFSTQIGWKDAFSVRLARIRIMNDIRSCGRQLEQVSWENPALAPAEAQRIIDSYQGRFVPPLIPFAYRSAFESEQSAREQLEALSVAVEVARFQAIHGSLPKTWEEAGIPPPVNVQLKLDEDGVSWPGGDWPIARRK